MIEPAIATDLGRIAASERDVRRAFQAGFTPEATAVARPAKVVKNDDPLSVALPESAFLVTQSQTGKLEFSRDGALHVAGGDLCAADGRPVLGFPLGEQKLAPLRVNRYDLTLGNIANIRVEADGTFGYTRSFVDPRSGERRAERVTLGRLALARFPAGTQPERVDAVHVRSPGGVTPLVGVPADGSFPALATFSRDLGRVDLVAALENMREAYSAYEALRAAHHTRGAVEKTAMDLVK